MEYAPQRPRLFRQDDKDRLRGILGQMRIAHDPPGGGVDQIDVSRDQFAKGRLRALMHVLAQALPVIHRSFHLLMYGRPGQRD